MTRFRALALALICALLLCAGEALCEAPGEDAPALYTATMSKASTIYGAMNDAKTALGRVSARSRVEVLFVEPTWALVRNSEFTGYVRRSTIENVKPVNEKYTPPYGVEVNRYIARVKDSATVYSAPGDAGDALITLSGGARLSLIDVTNGYARVVFKRQYGYVSTNALCELEMVHSAEEAPGGYCVAAFTSFYSLAENDANIGRMKNIDRACEKLEQNPLSAGETLDFNNQIGPYRASNGYYPAPVLIEGETRLGYGGGTCQVSSTLYNVILQLPRFAVLQRRAHGPSGAKYLPHGVDAAVGSQTLNLRIQNNHAYPIRFEASAQDGALFIAVYQAR